MGGDDAPVDDDRSSCLGRDGISVGVLVRMDKKLIEEVGVSVLSLSDLLSRMLESSEIDVLST